MNISATPKKLILAHTQPEFEAQIRKEFIEGSAINPELFDAAVQFAADIEVGGVGQEPREAIAEFLNWEVKTTQAGFSKGNSYFAALMHNEDGSPWQAKLSRPLWDKDKGKYRKYENPKANGSRAYLPPIPPAIRAIIEKRNGVKIPPDVPFWEWVKENPKVPIILTEGAKKALSLLSQGYVAIALSGCNGGYRRLDNQGTYDLINDLKPFCAGRGEFVIAFDRDEKPDRVNAAIRRMNGLLQDECSDLESEIPKGVIVRVALWDGAIAKGVDDLIVSQGADAIHKAIAEAIYQPQQAVWKCLMSRHHQIGDWKKKKVKNNEYVIDQESVEINTPFHTKALKRAKWDFNFVSVGIREAGKDDDEDDDDKTKTKTKTVETFRTFEPKCDFDFTVVKRLKSSEGGGLVLRVVRVSGNEIEWKDCYVKTSELLKLDSFMGALSREFGSNLACTLTNSELQALIQNRTAKYQRRGGQTYRLADRVGKQDDGTWVFENCQFKADGSPTTESDSLCVFNHQLSLEEQIPSPIIVQQDPNALKRLILAVEKVFAPIAVGYVLLDCGRVAAILQRDEVMDALKYFPQSWVYGEKNAGKTFSATIALSTVGMDKFTISKFSESALYERVKSLGCLPFLVDDPIKPGKMQEDIKSRVEEFLWNSYNGFPRIVRGNKQKPHTCLLFTGNGSVGENSAALESRLLKWDFPKLPIDKTYEDELKEACRQASGGF